MGGGSIEVGDQGVIRVFVEKWVYFECIGFRQGVIRYNFRFLFWGEVCLEWFGFLIFYEYL